MKLSNSRIFTGLTSEMDGRRLIDISQLIGASR